LSEIRQPLGDHLGSPSKSRGLDNEAAGMVCGTGGRGWEFRLVRRTSPGPSVSDPKADLADLAAAYVVGVARSRGFRDGNKRTGLASALLFIDVNGCLPQAPRQELYAVTMAAATGQADDTIVAALSASALRKLAECRARN
jgi:hypothetical protein